MKTLFAALSTLALTLSPVSSHAEEVPPLVPFPQPFVVNKDGNVPHLHIHAEKNAKGRSTLYLWGEILQGDSERFREAVEESKPINEIRIIASPGGIMDEGMQIGRIVHSYKLFTHIPGDGICVSACNFIFLGGVIRQIDLGGVFRVHMWAFNSAPIIFLLDMTKAMQEAESEQKGLPAVPSTNPNPQTAKVVDTVGKITPPLGLQAFGCDMKHLYSDTYDEKTVQKLAMQIETGKEPAPNEQIVVKSPTLLAQIRALALDSLCLEETTAHTAASVAQFIIEMRLSLDFLTDFSTIAHPLPVTFSREQLHRYNITNTE